MFPAIALGLGVVCLGAMAWFNGMLTLLFVALMALAYVHRMAARHGSNNKGAHEPAIQVLTALGRLVARLALS